MSNVANRSSAVAGKPGPSVRRERTYISALQAISRDEEAEDALAAGLLSENAAQISGKFFKSLGTARKPCGKGTGPLLEHGPAPGFVYLGDCDMNERDQQLLEKQLRGSQRARRYDGPMMLAILAVFLTGLSLGAFIVGESEPAGVAANNPAPTVAVLNGVPVIARE